MQDRPSITNQKTKQHDVIVNYSKTQTYNKAVKTGLALLVLLCNVACESDATLLGAEPSSQSAMDDASASSVSPSLPSQSANQPSEDLPAGNTNRAVKLMPLGDSITQGYNACSYRTPLVRLLQNYQVEFVGNQGRDATHPTGCTNTNFEHEGIGGWRTIDWLDTRANGWTHTFAAVKAELPDIVLLHIGSNDMYGKEHPGDFDQTTGTGTETIGRIDNMVEQIFAASPHTAIFVADLIPWLLDPTVNANLDLLRIEINKMIDFRENNGDKIALVEVYEGFQSQAMQSDSVHPNAEGDIYIANKWFQALQAAGFFLTTGNTTKVRIEAEHGTLSGNMKAGDDGSGYVSTDYSSGNQTDFVTLDFVVEDAGLYKILGNVKGTSAESGSLFFRMAQGDIEHWSIPTSGIYTTDYVGESNRTYVYLKAGVNSAIVYSKRSDVRLDWLEFQYLGANPNGDVDGDGVANVLDTRPNSS